MASVPVCIEDYDTRNEIEGRVSLTGSHVGESNMISYRVATALFVLNFGFIATAQSVTSTAGTANAVPKYSNATTITPSAIYESNGSVGIGTTSPASPLSVVGTSTTVGTVNVSTPNATDASFIDFNIQGLGVFGQITDNNGINFKSRGNLLFTPSGSGGVGIKTTTPQQALDVNGSIRISGANGALIFPDGTSLSTAPVSSPTQTNNGTAVTTSGGTSGMLPVFSGSSVLGSTSIAVTSPVHTLPVIMLRTPPSNQINTVVDSRLLFEGIASGDGSTATPWGLNISSVPWSWSQDPITYHGGGHTFRVTSGNTGETDMMWINSGGVGVQSGLYVVGSIDLAAGSGGSMKYPDNTVQSTAWNGTTCGGDYAESIDVGGERKNYEPGDVLVIDAKQPDKFRLSEGPYSKLVAGIYSTKPGLTGRRQGAPKTGEEIPMAMLGIVPAKVSAENGAIEPGDLLVSSSTPGRAMKGDDTSKLTGAVIGKAMGRLSSGTGTIEVLVSLQ